ncbi:MAG: hypothetical protein HYX92_09715 [Chloroflexi bacterium]|nr:hypothetical protein [Chloroflexota bacterium]
MTTKAHEFDHLIGKFETKVRESGDLLAWFEVEGKIVTRTRRSKGPGDLPRQQSIRQQLKLSEAELKQATMCSLDRQGYINILRSKGLL